MSDLDEQISGIRKQIEEVQRRNARAEYERDAAAKAKAEAMKILEQYGCKDVDEAQKLLDSMERGLQEELVKIQAALDE